MTFEEKVLYHQIHPLKILTDVMSSILMFSLLWESQIMLAFAVGITPPMIASLVITLNTDLTKIKNSHFGKYLKRYMSVPAHFLRILALVIMATGAYMQTLWIMGIGLLILLATWGYGLFIP